MHLDYRCYFKFRREDQWRKALQRLIEGSDRQDYTFLEIGKMFSNLRRMMELMNTPMGQIFDTVESSEIGKYYFIHDHKKPRQYFPDLTQYIFEETGNIKSLSYDGHEGGFNLLNVPDELSNVPGGDFGNDYNVPFLDEAIGRKDVFSLVTEPNQASMYRINKDTGLLELSGFCGFSGTSSFIAASQVSHLPSAFSS